MDSINEARGGLLPLLPPKGGEVNGKNDKGGVGKSGRRIVLIQRKVGNMRNLGWKTGLIHWLALVNSGRIKNWGGVMY